MNIISHRGLWDNIKEKNTKEAIIKSFSNGFGIETDIRDLNGEIVISHDMPNNDDECLKFNELIDIYIDYLHLPLALNVKSDGMQTLIKNKILEYDLKNYFLFDMSIPDLIHTKKNNLNFLTRVSEYELPILIDDSKGVWADEFNTEWIDFELIRYLNSINKKLFIVSPELHNRNYIFKWEYYKKNSITKYRNIYLCTDYPLLARKFFYDKN